MGSKIGIPMFIRDLSPRNGSRTSLEVLSNALSNPRPLPDISDSNVGDKKTIQMLVILDKPAYFVEEFLAKVEALDYSKDLIKVTIVCRNPDLLKLAKTMLDKWSKLYKKVLLKETIKEALEEASKEESDYVFFVRSTAHLDHPGVLQDLVKSNVNIVAPLLRTYDTYTFPYRMADYDMGWNRTGTFKDPIHKILLDSQFVEEDVKENYGRFKQIQNFNIFNWTPIFEDRFDKWDSMRLTFQKDEQNERKYEVEAGAEDYYQGFYDTTTTGNPTNARALKMRYPLLHIEWSIAERRSCCLHRVLDLTDCYLVKKSLLKDFAWNPPSWNDFRPWMEDHWFSRVMQEERHHALYLLNKELYGQLVNLNPIELLETGVVNTLKKHPELVRTMENFDLWMERYVNPVLHKTMGRSGPEQEPTLEPDYAGAIKKGTCPDTVQFNLFNQKFLDDILEEAQAHQEKWEPANLVPLTMSGKTLDSKDLKEVPTQLELYKIDLELEIFGILKTFLFGATLRLGFPLELNNFHGINMKIVKFPQNPGVKYMAEELWRVPMYRLFMPLGANLCSQDSQEAQPGTETHFVRYDCTLENPKPGYFWLHPGSCTHHYQILPVATQTSQPRYHLEILLDSYYAGSYENHGVWTIPGLLQEVTEEATVEEKVAFLREMNQEIPEFVELELEKELSLRYTAKRQN